MGSFIAASGAFVPDDILDNEACARLAGVTPEWIVRRTGIIERRIAPATMGTAAMAARAAAAALSNAGVSSDDVDLILVATSTPDHLTPPTACEVQAKLGARRAAAFDVEAGFAAWIYAFIVADALLRTGGAANALVIGADKLSSITDRSDPETGPLFGDGAGAVLLTQTEAEAEAEAGAAQARLRSYSWWADGRLASALVRRGGGARLPFDQSVLAEKSHLLSMEGTRLFKHAVRTMAAQAESALERAGIGLDDVALIVPHQANLRILKTFAALVDVAWERVFVNIDRYGNTGAATIPLALHEAAGAGGLIRDGRPTLLVGFGAGATAGAIVLA
ncbi:MAG: 3-oxoacyl-ACP synthase III family protein [Gemmatimonadota bacterium]